MGFRRLNTLNDIAQAGYWVRLRCLCGHERRTDPRRLIALMMKRGAPTALDRLGEVLKCGKCGKKDFTAVHCEGPAVWS